MSEKRSDTQFSAGTKAPIEQGLLDRVVQGAKFVLTGRLPNEWFGPSDPTQPVAQDAAIGRQFDFPVAYNLQRDPRNGEAVSFAAMRALADSYDLLRIVIETRKDQMVKMNWQIVPVDEMAEADDRCRQLEEFFAFPDMEHDWQGWLRMLLEDMLVIDAATIYPRMNLGGKLHSLEPLDGATIKRILDHTGRTPLPPDPAYQQILKGMPAVNYTRDELVYRPRNPRTHKVYGYSPVEQIIMTVNIAMRRQVHQLQYYTEGNIPESIIGVPPEWNPEQIRQFQEYWDSLLEGNTAGRRHAKFVPGGLNFIGTKDAALKDEYDEWLARIVCFAFSIEPTPFCKQQNRATAETAREQSLAEGLAPLQNWVRDTMNFIIWKYFGWRDIQFKWQFEESVDPKLQAEINQIYINAKVVTPDEVRQDLGKEPLTPEERESAWPTPVFDPAFGGEEEQPEDDDEEPAPKKPKAKSDEEQEKTEIGKAQKKSPSNRSIATVEWL